jgi:hypothetical protein
MLQIKKLGRYVQTADELLFGRMEELQVTEVKTEEATEYSNFMPSPFVLAQHLLSTGHVPKELARKVSLVEVTAQNSAGEKFLRTYRFADAGRAADFARTMRDYGEENASMLLNIRNRGKGLPWYLPHIV